MDLRKLRHAVMLSEELNFARAAKKLHLTQPALSRSIRTLEEALGCRLFDRDLHGVNVTMIGRRVIERAREVLMGASNLEHEVALMVKQEFGDVKFGAGPFPAAALLPPILAELALTHPRLRVDIEINDWHQLTKFLHDGKLEFFVADVRAISDERGISVQRLPSQTGGLFCRPGHPLASSPTVSPHDIFIYPLASLRLPSNLKPALQRFLDKDMAGELPLHLVCENVALLLSVVLNSDAVLMMPPSAVRDELSHGMLVALKPTGLQFSATETGIVTLTGRSLSPASAWMVARILYHAKQHAEMFPVVKI